MGVCLKKELYRPLRSLPGWYMPRGYAFLYSSRTSFLTAKSIWNTAVKRIVKFFKNSSLWKTFAEGIDISPLLPRNIAYSNRNIVHINMWYWISTIFRWSVMWSLTTGIACSWLILMVVVATGSHIALVLRMTISFRNRIIWFLRAAAAVTTMLTACL